MFAFPSEHSLVMRVIISPEVAIKYHKVSVYVCKLIKKVNQSLLNSAALSLLFFKFIATIKTENEINYCRTVRVVISISLSSE